MSMKITLTVEEEKNNKKVAKLGEKDSDALFGSNVGQVSQSEVKEEKLFENFGKKGTLLGNFMQKRREKKEKEKKVTEVEKCEK